MLTFKMDYDTINMVVYKKIYGDVFNDNTRNGVNIFRKR